MKDFGIFILRVSVGLTMLFAHGLPKLMKFSMLSKVFPDPLGVGSQISLTLAVGAEFFCSILLVLGLFTRAALLPLITTMCVAFFIVHASDPWKAKELAFMYLLPFVTLLFTGGGSFTLSKFLHKWTRKFPGIMSFFTE